MRRATVIAGVIALLAAAAAAHAQTTLNGRPQSPIAPCSGTPSADTLLGAPGIKDCYVSQDASRPTAVQAANVMTDGSGVWAVTWARPFASVQPVINPLPVNTGALPILCNVSTRSATAASGQCWQSTATTLPATLSALVGLIVSPFGTPASNAAVMVIAREPTQ